MRPWKRIKWFFNPHDSGEPIKVVSHAVPVPMRGHSDPAWNAPTTRYQAFRLTPGQRARGHGGRWPAAFPHVEPAAPRRRPAIVPGTVLDVAPLDHRGDGGRLSIRVTEIGEEYRRVPTLEWLRVRGVVLRPDGVPGDETSAWIRAAALAEAVRPPGWLPTPNR